MSIQLIVGLGNPGPSYQATRHNAGFWYLDFIAAQNGSHFRADARYKAQVAEVSLNGHTCRLLKPQSFMNLSGTAVQAMAHFYKIPLDAILVAHDDLDLPCGVAKLKKGGGHGGHNGLRDIHAKLASADYWRLRIGIDHPRHQHGQDVIDYVLGVPELASKLAIEAALLRSYAIVPLLMAGNMASAQLQLHTASTL